MYERIFFMGKLSAEKLSAAVAQRGAKQLYLRSKLGCCHAAVALRGFTGWWWSAGCAPSFFASVYTPKTQKSHPETEWLFSPFFCKKVPRD
jgi:hypothetical protein